MTQVHIVHQTALHIRELARDAELPGYAQKLDRAADALEALEAELRTQIDSHAPRSAN